MRLTLAIAALATAFVFASPARAEPEATPAVRTALDEAAALRRDGQYSDAIKKIEAGEALPGISDYDKAKLMWARGHVYLSAHEKAKEIVALEQTITMPGFATFDARNRHIVLIATLTLENEKEQWDKVIAYGTQLAADKIDNEWMYLFVARAFLKTGNKAKAAAFAQISIDQSKAKGREPQAEAVSILAETQKT